MSTAKVVHMKYSRFNEALYSKQALLSGWMLFLACYFIASQPLDRTSTTNAAIVIWTTGFLLLPTLIKRKEITRMETGLFGICAAALITASLSWYTSDYYDGSTGDLEIDLRFLLFPLAYFAYKQSYFTSYHLTFALSIGAITYSWIAWSSPETRISGDENAVSFGNGSFLLMAVSLLLIHINKDWYWKLAATAAACAYAYAAYKSGTRGSFLAIPAITLILFFALPSRQKIIFIILTISASIFLLNGHMGLQYKKGITNTLAYFEENKVASSIGQRIEQWKAGMCLFSEAPLLGKGAHQFKQAIQDPNNSCQITITNTKGFYEQAHSFYVNTLATKGLIGLTAEIILFAYIVYMGFTRCRKNGLLLIAAVSTMLSYGFTVDLFFHRYLIDKHLILLAILLAINFESESKNKNIN